MLKEAAAVAGGALLLPPLGVSVVACGIPGLLIAGVGFFVADNVLNAMRPPEEPSGNAHDEVPDGRQGYPPGKEGIG